MGVRVLVITGAARGIGRSIATYFAENNYRVIIVNINEVLGAETVGSLRERGLDANYQYADLSKRGASECVIESIIESYGRIDVLINNARARDSASFEEEDEENWDLAMSVMLRAPFFASRAAIQYMQRLNIKGSIINIGSILSRYVIRGSPAYHVAKAGLVQMTRYLAVQAAECGVRVNAISPGFIVQDEHMERFESEGNECFRETAIRSVPLGRVGRSVDIAQSAFFLCSEASLFITGQEFILDGGSTIREHLDILQQQPTSINFYK